MPNKDGKKLVLVTGATGGIGTEICKAFYEDGAAVIVNYHTASKMEQWKTEMEANGFTGFEFLEADVSDFQSTAGMFEKISQLGSLDVLVNNAGVTADSSFKKMSFEQWDFVIRTNLYSVFNCCKHAVESMSNAGYGRIVNISSINGQKGQFGQVNYSASKAGIHGFTKSLAMEVARKNITVNTVSPGYTATEMVKKVPEKVLGAIVDQIPLGRLAEPAEIAQLVVYLASDNAGFMTGSNLSINGGQHVY